MALAQVLDEELKPGTQKHMKLRNLIRSSIDMSYRVISQNFPVWDNLERSYRAYRPSDGDDAESFEKHGVQKIIVPIQFATLQTMTTFMMEVFTALKPTLRVRGTDPSTRKRATIMELCLDYDYRGNRGYLILQQWFLNAFRYGYAIIENSWGTRTVLKQMMMKSPPTSIKFMGMNFQIAGVEQLQRGYFKTFEGNQWQIIDNRQFFPDPRVPITRFNEGQFCGRRTQIHDNELHKMQDDGLMFNVDLVKSTSRDRYDSTSEGAESSFDDNQRSRIVSNRALLHELADAKKMGMHINEQLIIELIPRDFALSEEDRPEQWLFNLIDDTVITRAEPNPFYGFNYAIIECYPDILATMSQGVMELTDPLSQHLNFLFNSHMANVRKAINDMMLVDPSRIDLRDLLDPKAGKVIRLLPLAYGTNPAEAVQQLNVIDITRGHVEDAKMILELWQRITGATDQMFGQISTGRRTAFELQGVFRQAGSRMKMLADLMSCEGVAPLTEMMAITRQENMEMAQFMEIAGQSAADLGVAPEEIVEGFLKVRRDHINGVFSYPAEEGVLPQDRAAAAEVLQQVFEAVAKYPFLMSFFDPVSIFREVVRQRGIHHIDDFMNKGIRAQANIVPDQILQEMLAKQMIKPFDTGSNGEKGRPDEGVRTDRNTLSVNGALSGAGAKYE